MIFISEEQNKKVGKEDLKKLKEDIGKKKIVDKQEIIQQIATRQRLERDYNEDVIEVVFYSSPETKRKVLAKRPTQKQMITIMKLSAEATIYEAKVDPKSISKMTEIYEKLNQLAAELTIDNKLDEVFWSEKVSFSTLQNFIMELIQSTQKGSGLTSEEMDSFR